MKIIIFGAGGQLGLAFVKSLSGKHSVSALTKREIDVTDRIAVSEAVNSVRPDVLINAAALTDVDGCERSPDSAYITNGLAVRWQAQAAEGVRALFVQISTDYVFDGRKGSPYHEWDPVGPIQVYGSSKLAGEWEARLLLSRHLIVRTSWLYGGHEKGFLQAVLRQAREGKPLSVVTTQAGSPSFTGDVAKAVGDLIEAGVFGTVHLTNGGRATRYDFAREIVNVAGIDADISPAEVMPPTALAPRPRDTSLRSLVAAAAGVRMRPWQDALEEFIKQEG